MKTPLRFQITEFDCGTVSLLNAFCYLFNRKEIPALLVKSIFSYTMDCYDENGQLGQGGTSREAIDKLTAWIAHYANTNDFHVKCERLTGEDVTLAKMTYCLAHNGVIFVRCWQDVEHYVIITKIRNQKVYIFDPYYIDKKHHKTDKQVKLIFNKPFTHNRIVSLQRVFSETHQDFALGPIYKRDCILINKI